MAPTEVGEEVVTRVDIIRIRKPIITIEIGSMELRSRFSVWNVREAPDLMFF
jgi:hypothetical protein